MPSLLDMTDVPMTNILEKCSYKSVLTLRKVCHSLRNFIDDACFQTDMNHISITIGPTGFSVIFHTHDGLWTDGTGYAEAWTTNDLKIILKMAQNSKLSCFSVNINPNHSEGLDDLEEILKNQTRPIQTECFEMEGSEVLKVLPYLDSKTLKEISIRQADHETEDQSLEGIQQFLELDQFKNAVILTIDEGFLVRAPLRKFLHFQEVYVNLYETSLEKLVALKEAFVTSTHMQFFGLYDRNLNENQLEQVFGTSIEDLRYTLDGCNWYFKIRNCKEHVLKIEFISGCWIRFMKSEVKDIPENAFVQS